MKHCRRVISHHGSDCPDGPHSIRRHRCIILTRIDRPGEMSRAWISGDCAETMPMHLKGYDGAKSERLKRKDHTFKPNLPTWYGGGFWDKVTIGPADHAK
jgi:hypothetical protein